MSLTAQAQLPHCVSGPAIGSMRSFGNFYGRGTLIKNDGSANNTTFLAGVFDAAGVQMPRNTTWVIMDSFVNLWCAGPPIQASLRDTGLPQVTTQFTKVAQSATNALGTGIFG